MRLSIDNLNEKRSRISFKCINCPYPTSNFMTRKIVFFVKVRCMNRIQSVSALPVAVYLKSFFIFAVLVQKY